MADSEIKIVAVTGASGFIGSHVTEAALTAGLTVRATVRDKDNAVKTAHLTKLAVGKPGTLELWSADLMKEGDFDPVFKGCEGVIHCAAVVANPRMVKDPMADIVAPSVKGTQNVIDSIGKSGSVRRVVITSSVAAVQAYDKGPDYVFTEKDWNEWSSAKNGDYYGLAKVEAEKLIKKASTENGFELTAINPGVVFGPCLTKAHTKASPVFIRELIYGNQVADISASFVDVRDVATAHIGAMQRDGLNGKRFILVGDNSTHFFRNPTLAASLEKLFPTYNISCNLMGGVWFNIQWFLFMNEFEKSVQTVECNLSNAASKEVLGITYTPADTTLTDTVNSMVEGGFIKVKTK